ncbi:hypothetical protein ACFLQU_01000 [Verrucomicrobiota bacterium]
MTTEAFGINCTNPDCGQVLKMEGSYLDWADQTVNCPHCNTEIIIPGVKLKEPEQGNLMINCTNPDCSQTLELEGPKEDWAGETVECPGCGTQIVIPGKKAEPEISTCPNCGTVVGIHAVLCVNCGTNVKTGQQVAPTFSKQPAVDEEGIPTQSIVLAICMGVIGLLSLIAVVSTADQWSLLDADAPLELLLQLPKHATKLFAAMVLLGTIVGTFWLWLAAKMVKLEGRLAQALLSTIATGVFAGLVMGIAATLAVSKDSIMAIVIGIVIGLAGMTFLVAAIYGGADMMKAFVAILIASALPTLAASILAVVPVGEGRTSAGRNVFGQPVHQDISADKPLARPLAPPPAVPRHYEKSAGFSYVPPKGWGFDRVEGSPFPIVADPATKANIIILKSPLSGSLYREVDTQVSEMRTLGYAIIARQDFTTRQGARGVKVVASQAPGGKKYYHQYYYFRVAGQLYLITASCSYHDRQRWSSILDSCVKTYEFEE